MVASSTWLRKVREQTFVLTYLNNQTFGFRLPYNIRANVGNSHLLRFILFRNEDAITASV